MPTRARFSGVNHTQIPQIVSDGIALKGLPQTAGYPAGYGDLASAITSAVNNASLLPLNPVDGQIYNVIGFYENTEVGGGGFIYNPILEKSNHNGGTVIAPEAIAAWDGTHTGLDAMLNWSGAGLGCYVRMVSGALSPLMFGATNGELDDTASVNKCFDAAYPAGVVEMPSYVKIVSGPLVFRNGVTVNGNGCLILNYSNGDACTIHPSDSVVRSTVSGLNVRYMDYMTPRNPYSPPYTIDRTARLGNNIRWTHLAAFAGDGFKHSTSGRFFTDLQECTCFHHRYGLHMLGWVIKLKNIKCDFNLIGILGSSAEINGVRYPVHNLAFSGCRAVNNTQVGVKVQYADGVDFGDLHAERNGVNNLFIEGLRGYKSGSMYFEYAQDSIYSFNNIGGELNSFSQGNNTGYIEFGKQTQSYYELILASPSQAVAVPAYDGVTKLGINGFASISKDDVAVILNGTYITPAQFTKVGAVITVPSSTAGQTLRVLAYPFVTAWTPTSTTTNEKYLLGGVVPIRAAHTRDLQFSGFIENYTTNIAINDFDLANNPATKNIYYNAGIAASAKADLPQVFYPWGEGFAVRPSFTKGVTFTSAFDGNIGTTITVDRKYPALNSVVEHTYADAAKSIFIVTGDDGAGVFTIDAAGNLYPLMSSSNRYTFATSDLNESGKLNFYSGAANRLRVNNRLGYSTGFNLMIIKGK